MLKYPGILRIKWIHVRVMIVVSQEKDNANSEEQKEDVFQ